MRGAPTQTSKCSHARETHLHGRTLEAFADRMAGRRAGKEATNTHVALAAPDGIEPARRAEQEESDERNSAHSR